MFALRGSAYLEREDNNKAIADFSKAIELNKKEVQFYLQRGIAYYRQSLYRKAIEDFRKGIDINGKHEYSRIWTLLAYRKISKDDCEKYENEFRSYILTNRSDEWIRAISRYYLRMDSLKEEDVMSEAKNGKDEREINQRLCEAYYYLGEERLWKGDRKAAEEYFRKSMETNVHDFIEYSNAKAMLKLMKEGKI